jgi:hypothetical protein
MKAAPCTASRTTFVGSMMPALIISDRACLRVVAKIDVIPLQKFADDD